MKKPIATMAAILAIVVMVGGGCIQFKGSGTEEAEKYGVWQSIDGGFTWEEKFAYPKSNEVSSIGTLEIGKLILDPSDDEAMYIASRNKGLFFTYNNATTWQRIREPILRTGRIRSLAVNPKDKCTIYVPKANRLTKTEDCGRTFEKEIFVDPRSDATIIDVEIDWFNPNVVYILNSKGEVIKTSDAGKTWQTKFRRAPGARELTIDKTDSRILLIGTAQKGIIRSTDSAESWEEVMKKGYEDYEGIMSIRDIKQTKDSALIWMSTDAGIARSEDHGLTWKRIKLITPPNGINISALAVDPNDQDHIIYTAGDTFYSSVNRGKNWDTEKLPINSNARAAELIIDKNDSSTVYMGVKAVTVQ